ncbi:glycosyltransferase [Leptolyngbya cf. ectocarpi LEGE 11479]|uniref:Glycosyltransferase n=1 Tax=Leptolyngbya cf. ectocarpi LEGE 11479 TaxID=1828722 RepID=A0A928WZI7_LEPEC|nr:glycosyltransferase [Leptolyngbya ectocarpi]MBE9066264.1 glycosyltransferase [Leptolyngbya cf. ectocarpi LEGE 11479]
MTEKTPLVSILVNNYNYGSFLSQSIDSALHQTYNNIEVIVVDDGSQDNSHDIIHSYGNKIIPVLKANGGQASALNAGFSSSRGNIICLLDADDIYLPNKVAEVVNAFRKDPNTDWFFHRATPYQSSQLLTDSLTSIFKDVAIKNPKENPRKIDFRSAVRNAKSPSFAPSTSNICLSRALAEKIFPMPEVPGKSGVAISDLYIKLLAVGLGVGYQTERKLCLFRLHNNIYSDTEAVNKRKIGAEISIATGYWIRAKGADFEHLSNKLLAKGISLRKKCRLSDKNFNNLIEIYLSHTNILGKIKLNLMIFYYLTHL